MRKMALAVFLTLYALRTQAMERTRLLEGHATSSTQGSVPVFDIFVKHAATLDLGERKKYFFQEIWPNKFMLPPKIKTMCGITTPRKIPEKMVQHNLFVFLQIRVALYKARTETTEL